MAECTGLTWPVPGAYMIVKPLFAACIAIALTTPVLAQSTSGKPLDLQLPPNSLPAPASTSSRAAATQPGMYYGDTSGRVGASDRVAETLSCDDDTYGKPQVHGSVGMGVVAGDHVSGNYQSGTVNIAKAFGSCDDPRGSMSISVGVGKGHFHGPHRDH